MSINLNKFKNIEYLYCIKTFKTINLYEDNTNLYYFTENKKYDIFVVDGQLDVYGLVIDDDNNRRFTFTRIDNYDFIKNFLTPIEYRKYKIKNLLNE